MSAEVTSAVTEEVVLELIHAELADSGVKREAITPDATFDDLRIDSLDGAQLVAAIKDRFGVAIPQEDLAEATVGGLAARVVESIPSSVAK